MKKFILLQRNAAHLVRLPAAKTNNIIIRGGGYITFALYVFRKGVFGYENYDNTIY